MLGVRRHRLLWHEVQGLLCMAVPTEWCQPPCEVIWMASGVNSLHGGGRAVAAFGIDSEVPTLAHLAMADESHGDSRRHFTAGEGVSSLCLGGMGPQSAPSKSFAQPC
jgi:hypothetical protein